MGLPVAGIDAGRRRLSDIPPQALPPNEDVFQVLIMFLTSQGWFQELRR